MFVESSLSNGGQFADLCSYNVYRAFKGGDLSYPYFARLVPAFYTSPRTASEKIDGLKVFPDESPLVQLVRAFEDKRREENDVRRDNPIEPTSGTGQS